MNQALAFQPSPDSDRSAPNSAAVGGDDAAWLRGRTVLHKIVFAVVEPAACLAAVLAELARVGGDLHSLHLHPTGQGTFEAVLRVTRIGSEDAARMLDRLARRPDVRSAALEHVLIT